MRTRRPKISVKLSCHCGAVMLELLELPRKVHECNCSFCRRIGALWVYRSPDKVRILSPSGATTSYFWGDRTAEYHRCGSCGCTTHWLPLSDEYSVMGINARGIDELDPALTEVVHMDNGKCEKFWC